MKNCIRAFTLFICVCSVAYAQLPGTFQPLLTGNVVIGTPVSLGSVINTGGDSNTTVLTVGATAPAGSLIVVGAFAAKASTVSVSSVADSAGNTYSLAKATGWDSGSFLLAEMWYKANATSLPSGGTITITWSATVLQNSSNAGHAEAGYVTGVTATPLDASASGLGGGSTSTTPSIGPTATLAQTNEIAFGYIGGSENVAPQVVTEAAGFTLLVEGNKSAATNYQVGHLAYKIVAATTALTYAPTFGTAAFWDGVLATFKGF